MLRAQDIGYNLTILLMTIMFFCLKYAFNNRSVLLQKLKADSTNKIVSHILIIDTLNKFYQCLQGVNFNVLNIYDIRLREELKKQFSSLLPSTLFCF